MERSWALHSRALYRDPGYPCFIYPDEYVHEFHVQFVQSQNAGVK